MLSAESPEPLAQAHRDALKVLREMAMDLATRLHARADEPDADLGEVATRFARVARVVRQTIFLESRLADDERRRAEAAERAAPATDQLTPDDAPWWVTHRMTLAEMGEEAALRRLKSLTVVQRAVARAPEPERERVQERLLDGLEDEFGIIMRNENVGWSIAKVCRDLGLSPDWTGFSDRDWGATEPDLRAAVIAADASERRYNAPPPPYEPPPPIPEAWPKDPDHPHSRRRERSPAWNS